MFVIITDGEENSSWEFVFPGANIDAMETASHFGISADRAVDYVPDAAVEGVKSLHFL